MIMNNLTKDFVPNEQSLELKELGFDESCFGYYVDGELRGIDLGIEELGGVEPYYQRFGFHVLNNHDMDNPNKVVATAPTFSQAFRWFRENYNLNPLIAFCEYAIESENAWKYTLDNPTKVLMWDGKFNTYEEAELVCLRKLIEIVKGGNK